MLLADATFSTRGFGGISEDNRQIIGTLRKHNGVRALFQRGAEGLQSIDSSLALKLSHINGLALIRNKPFTPINWDGNYFQGHLSGLGVPNDTKTNFLRLHDIFPLSNPEWFTSRGRFIFSLAARNLPVNTVLLCNSFSTKRRVMEHELFSKFESVVLPCKISKSSNEIIECGTCDWCRQGSPQVSYLLSVGTIEPRKNYSRLLEAWNLSRRHSHFEKLVVVGKSGWKTSGIQKSLKSEKNVLWTSPCKVGLENIYKNAAGFISASLAEGFDIPSMEARTYGLESALSDIDVHRELHPDNQIFFDPTSVKSISKAISFLIPTSKIQDNYFSSSSFEKSLEELLPRMLDS